METGAVHECRESHDLIELPGFLLEPHLEGDTFTRISFALAKSARITQSKLTVPTKYRGI